MKVNHQKLLEIISKGITPETSELFEMLIKHFEYSIKDIKSYDELTHDEKLIIKEDLFNKIII